MYNFSCHLTCKHCQTSLWVFIITHFQLVIATLMENDFKSKCFHCSVLRLYLSNRKKNQPTIFSFCSISSIPERDGELKSTGKYLAIHIFIYWDNLLPCWCKFLWFQGKKTTPHWRLGATTGRARVSPDHQPRDRESRVISSWMFN